MDSFIRTFRDNTPDAVRKRLLPRPNLAISDQRRAVVKQVIEFTKMFYPDRRGGTGELLGFVDALRSPHPAWQQNIEGIAMGFAHSMSIARGYRDDEKEYIDVLRFHLGLGPRPKDLSQKVEAGLPELVKLAETVKPGLMEGGNAHGALAAAPLRHALKSLRYSRRHAAAVRPQGPPQGGGRRTARRYPCRASTESVEC